MSDALLIAVSGYGSEQDRIRAQAVGFDMYLLKPIEIEVLEQLLVSQRH